jgi:HTH-type transcriptional regulator / antitoxin HipB
VLFDEFLLALGSKRGYFTDMAVKYIRDDLGKVIRFHRKQAGLTQLELARLANVGKTLVFDVEKGKLTVRYQALKQVLDALNIKLQWESPLRASFENSLTTKKGS